MARAMKNPLIQRIIVWTVIFILAFLVYKNSHDHPMKSSKGALPASRHAFGYVYQKIEGVLQTNPHAYNIVSNTLGTNAITVAELNLRFFSNSIPPLPDKTVFASKPEKFCDGWGYPLLFQILPSGRTDANAGYVIWSVGYESNDFYDIHGA
jgi:hypothetical protein